MMIRLKTKKMQMLMEEKNLQREKLFERFSEKKIRSSCYTPKVYREKVVKKEELQQQNDLEGEISTFQKESSEIIKQEEMLLRIRIQQVEQELRSRLRDLEMEFQSRKSEILERNQVRKEKLAEDSEQMKIARIKGLSKQFFGVKAVDQSENSAIFVDKQIERDNGLPMKIEFLETDEKESDVLRKTWDFKTSNYLTGIDQFYKTQRPQTRQRFNQRAKTRPRINYRSIREKLQKNSYLSRVIQSSISIHKDSNQMGKSPKNYFEGRISQHKLLRQSLKTKMRSISRQRQSFLNL